MNPVAAPGNARPPVVFVGAGPGHPDLLTVRALRALQQAEVVIHDALGVSAEVLALCAQARLVDVGKRAGRASTAQAFIDRRLVNEALHGHRVVRLKGGDPTIFGRLEEEIAALRAAGLHYEIVPGITAASAAAAAAGVPLTRRGVARSVCLTTPATGRGERADEAWLADADPGGTTAVYMAGRGLAGAARALIGRGYCPSTPAIVALGVETPDQVLQHLSLASLAMPRISAADDQPSPRPSGTFDDRPCVLLVGRTLQPRDITTMAAERTG